MTTTTRKAVEDAPVCRLRDDPELLEAVLEAHRCLEMSELLSVLLRYAMGWSGATVGLAWGSAGEGRSFRRAAASFGRDDPRYLSIQKVRAGTLREWFGDQSGPLRGLGPLATIVSSGISRGPHGRVIPVKDTANQWAGLIWLGFDGEPDAAICARLDELFDHARQAVGHAMQVVGLRRLIIKDDTAACFNRRYFEEFLPEELARAARFRSPVSLIFLDMDNLKEVNTLHGHSMGSQTLLEVSRRIRSRIRKFDKLFRFGGDEFCIVLPETEWHGALEVAERVREAIIMKTFLQDEIGGGGISMTASLGIASFPLHARTQKGLIAMADRAMQQVKKKTKNAVGIAETTGEDADGGTTG
ncbi:MAG: diguanylate cyclase [Acidobacteria bacterium]|nr:diguanylate cyclase [Acidobacteriota bacterium]NIM60506.1 diguanylate cyclase [Acidobacteriota bacterium]NIO59477.1 diguanylate cyclase [Acidobacteriota bacterium]NIQ30506.1 diguanylate cyclase [Acidobacteriota bacterium]NIQ85454.1 diguanylate cyclase [Acidobacteriota bacterium]